MVNALEKSGFLEQPLHGTSSKLVKIFRQEKSVKPRVLGGEGRGRRTGTLAQLQFKQAPISV